MKVYIDGQESADLIGEECAVSILEAVERRMSEAGRVVIEIRLDDVIMDAEAFSNVSGGLRADFTSSPVRDLVLETLDGAIHYIPRLTKGLEEIAHHFESNDLAAGEAKLADGAEGLNWLLQVFQKCSLLLAMNNADNNNFSEMSSALSGIISSLGTFHSEKKYFQMSFCIRQELVPEIEKFSMHIQKLRDVASSTQ